MYQVVAPDQPCMQAGSFNLRDRHLFCLEEVDELAIGPDEIVFGSAGDPEEAEVGGFGVERRQLLGVVEIVDRGAEAADPGELAGVSEANFETFKAAHREAGDGAVVAVFGHVIFGLHAGQHFGE